MAIAARVPLFPSLEAAVAELAEAYEPRCRGCGCTDERACAGGCMWVEDPDGMDDLCSSCLIRIWNAEPLPLTQVAG